MNSNLKLSVVVPCYNAENTVAKCVDSIINSTYTEIEVILIDDGSSDETKKIIDGFASHYNNIFSFSKCNEGLGLTRNYGIKHAKGELITFIDSDDYIDSTAYENMIKQMEADESDVVYCGFRYVFSDYSKKNNFNCKLLYEDYNDFLEYILSDKECFAGISACTGIYKYSILKRIENPFYSEKEYLSEDKLFNFRYLNLANKISIVPKQYYNYVQNDQGSITTSFKKYKFYAAYNLYLEMIKLNKNKQLIKLIEYDFLVNLSSCFEMLVKSKNNKFRNKIKIINEIINRKEINDVINGFELNGINKKSKIFKKLFLYKKSILIYFVYLIKLKLVQYKRKKK